MKKILNQDEIDALFKRAHKGAAGGGSTPKPRPVVACNFRQAGLISNDHVRSISALHETFARNLSHSLGAYLRVRTEINLVSVEQLMFAEFLERVPELSFVGTIDMRPLDAVAVMQYDLGLGFPLVDLLLGGQGKNEIEQRDLTEIEEQVLASVVNIICRELHPAWQAVTEELVFQGRQHQSQVVRLISARERVLCVSFEVRLAGAQGNLNFAFPPVAAGGLLRTLAQQFVPQRLRGHRESTGRVRKRLLKCRFPVSLALPAVGIRFSELMNLSPGQVLGLQWSLEKPAMLVVGSRPAFTANAVGSGNARAAQLLERFESTMGSDLV